VRNESEYTERREIQANGVNLGELQMKLLEKLKN